jgi:two-component sensor histidine kinase
VLTKDAASFELIFRPNIELISVVRKFVESFYREILDHDDITFRLALATHELLENAVKYSSNGETIIRIAIHRSDAKEKRVVIETSNKAHEANQQALLALFEEMNAEHDAFAYYQKLMQRSVKRRDGSGLGIARIRAEAEMSVRLNLEHDGRVHILAEADVAEEVRA